jgi:hypothetical protein
VAELQRTLSEEKRAREETERLLRDAATRAERADVMARAMQSALHDYIGYV